MQDLDRSAYEDGLRRALVEYGRLCYDRKLITSTDGNLSVRLDATCLIITPAAICKGRLQARDLMVIDMQGRPTEAGATGRVSSETPMHLEIYRQRPDVNAVIHAHPVFATALSVAGLEFPIDILPESLALLQEVPTTVFAAPSSTEDADAVRSLILKHNALLLRQHGALTCGPDLETALNILERMEFVAEIFHRAHSLGHVEHLSVQHRRLLQQPGDHHTLK